jgi:hypothetical protein
MTPEEKDLLLKDLCARLPYGVKCNVGDDKPYTLSRIEIDDKNGFLLDFKEKKDGLDMQVYLSEVKPYLFPLSSMTEEQRNEFLNIQSEERKILFDALVKYRYEKEDKIPIIPSQKHIDWLTKNNFDYRGLIEIGLANDATGLNIY